MTRFQAFAPAVFAAGLSAGFSMRTGVELLALISAAGLACFWFASHSWRATYEEP